MKYLLDTCVLLWSLNDDQDKITLFTKIIKNPHNFIAVSVITYWEIVIKQSLGKLTVPDNINDIVTESGFTWINLELRHVRGLQELPLLHTDPFDRLLIAQAKVDDYEILTTDKQMQLYFNKT